MKQKLIIANWKAYITTQKQLREYFEVFSHEYPKLNLLGRNTVRFSSGKTAFTTPNKTSPPKVVFCVPFLYLLPATNHKLQIAFGAPDVFWENTGPYTSAVTPIMLRDVGATHAIIGHSERRKYFGESDEMVSKKVHAALAAKLQPIVCVGEWEKSQNDEEAKNSLDFVKNQLQGALRGIKKPQMKNVILTYEPVWAISGNQGVADTPENAARMIMFIRRILAKLYGAHIAKNTRVIYGGSVNPENVASFGSAETIDGVLVGHASANVKEFLKIIAEVIKKQ